MKNYLYSSILVSVALLMIVTDGCTRTQSVKSNNPALVLVPRLGVNFGTLLTVKGELHIKSVKGLNDYISIIVLDAYEINGKKLSALIEIPAESVAWKRNYFQDKIEALAKANQPVQLIGYETFVASGIPMDPDHYANREDFAYQDHNWVIYQKFVVSRIDSPKQPPEEDISEIINNGLHLKKSQTTPEKSQTTPGGGLSQPPLKK